MLNKQRGITLVALVITIVILIILATVSINAVFGENGLIRKAEQAKEIQEEATKNEEEGINTLLGEFGEVMGELPVAPKLSDGMVPVKWNGSNWVKTTAEDKEWYDYGNKQWANVVLTPTSGEKEGKDATGETDVFNEDGTLNENSAYSMLVWIPRYAYQITSGYHQSGAEINPSDATTGAGNINIVFIDTENKNNAGTKRYSEIYPSYETGTGMYGVAEEGCEAGYVVHPAFNFGEEKLAGFWVGKYETSNTNCTTDVESGQVAYTGNETVTIKAGVTSWRNINISNMFTTCINLNKSGNSYGLNTSDDVVDPHMMKNTEWGAVAYLSKSKYGKETEVWINPNSNCITGQAGNSANASNTISTNVYNTINGMQASTTGNVTGVYDMSGGVWEYVAAYIYNEDANLNNYGSALVNADDKYKDVYSVGSSDTSENNYEVSTPSNGKYGDAIYETSSSVNSLTDSWYSDRSNFPTISYTFFMRGGELGLSSSAGIFGFNRVKGISGNINSFRIVISIM